MAPVPSKRSAWFRRLGVVGATFTCLCCATLPHQTANTTVELSGGYARAVHNSFGCGGNVVATQIDNQEIGGLSVVHEREGGLTIGGAVGGMREIVKEVRQYDANPTGRIDWMGSGGAFAGFHGRWIAWELGAAYTPVALVPYAAVRGGDLSRFWGELRAGSLQPLMDPRLFTFGAGFRSDLFSVRPWVGFIGRPMHVYQWHNGERFEDNTLGTVNNTWDPAGGLEAAFSVSEEADVFFHVIGAEAPSGQIGLRIRLGGENGL